VPRTRERGRERVHLKEDEGAHPLENLVLLIAVLTTVFCMGQWYQPMPWPATFIVLKVEGQRERRGLEHHETGKNICRPHIFHAGRNGNSFLEGQILSSSAASVLTFESVMGGEAMKR
jgi:hypothetical protein